MPRTNFQQVADMNEAFGNRKGDRLNIDLGKLKSQCKNILDEYNELMEAIEAQDMEKIRDSLCDIHVFAYGAHHFMGLNADADMEAVVESIYSRFVKNVDDLDATLDKHAAKGVNHVYFEGEYPNLIVKSASAQKDAPVGKFLKSASYREPKFIGAAMFSNKKPVDFSDN